MAYDSVLDREMFRPKSRGVVSLDDTNESEDLRSRREKAMAMIDAAKEKFDPKNFQTLTEQDRPGVFRPVAVNMPAQQPTANTAMRMQQMAAQGVRPVGMARGGLTDDFYSSSYDQSYDLAQYGLANNKHLAGRDYALPSYDPETMAPTLSSDAVEPTVSSDDEEYYKRLERLRKRLRDIRDMKVDAGKATFDLEDTTETINPETGLPAPSGDLYPNAPENLPPLDAKGEPIRGSRQVLRPERGIADINVGKELERRERELTEKAIEKRAETPPPRVVPSGQFVRPEYARPLTQQELAVRKAAEEGVSVATPGAVVTSPAAAPSSEDGGVASLVGSGRGAVERPGERAAYARSRAEGTLPSGTKTPDTGIKAVGAAKEHPTSLPDIKRGRDRDREDAFNMALMQAGLAIAAGRSSNALTNIGEGGIAGLQAYANQVARNRAADLEERKMNMMEKYYGSREKASGIAEQRLANEYIKARSNARAKAEDNWNNLLKADMTLSSLRSSNPAAYDAQKKKYIESQLVDFEDQFASQVSIAGAAAPNKELVDEFSSFQ